MQFFYSSDIYILYELVQQFLSQLLWEYNIIVIARPEKSADYLTTTTTTIEYFKHGAATI
jgi:hypothetical protein